MVDGAITAFLGLFFFYRVTENLFLMQSGRRAARTRFEWTAALIVVPYFFAVAAPIVEYMLFRLQSPYAFRIVGAALFVAATVIRCWAHLDFGAGVSMLVEDDPAAALVDRGLYRYIRHPLYLSNVLLYVACPLFLACRLSWLMSAIGLAGVLIRLQIEEEWLTRNLAGYRDYITRTWALVPGIF